MRLHLVAIGANLHGLYGQEPRATCEWAAIALMALTDVRSACRSRWFSSAPIPASIQPRYVNGVVRLEGAIEPERLLARLHELESRAGRVRGERDGARILDLDIVDMAGLIRDAPDPVLPHPRAHLRAFVLLPLRDVAPEWVHPRLGLGLAAMIAALPAQDIRPV